MTRTTSLAVLLGTLVLVLVASAVPATAQDGQVETNSVVILAGPATVSQPVRGDVVVFSNGVTVSAPVEGNLVVFSGPATLARGGRVGGDVVYGEQRPDVPEQAVAGSIQRLNFDSEGLGFAASLGFWLAFSVSSLVIGLLLLWLAPRALRTAYVAAGERTGVAIAWGLALVIGLPVVAVLALVTVVGIPLGVAILLALFPLFALAYSTSCWLLGRRLVRPPRSALLAFFAGWGILRVLALIPVAGGLVSFSAVLFGLGVLIVAIWQARGAVLRQGESGGAARSSPEA